MGGSNVEIRFVTGNQGKVNEIRRSGSSRSRRILSRP